MVAHWYRVIQRAWRDTLSCLGFPRSARLAVIASSFVIAIIVLKALWGGEQVSEELRWGIAIALAGGILFVLTFLYYLLFAPSQMEGEAQKRFHELGEQTLYLKLRSYNKTYPSILSELSSLELSVLNLLLDENQIGRVKTERKWFDEDPVEAEAYTSLGEIRAEVGVSEKEFNVLADNLLRLNLCRYCTYSANKRLRTLCLTTLGQDFIRAYRKATEV